MKRALWVKLDFPECPVGTPLGQLEINDNPKSYFLISPEGLRTQLHELVPDPTYRDYALVQDSKIPLTTLYQRSTTKIPKRRTLPEISGDFVQGPIVKCARLFYKEPQVNLNDCTDDEAVLTLCKYLQRCPMSSRHALHQHFQCPKKRMDAILTNPDLVTRTHTGSMFVYSVKKC